MIPINVFGSSHISDKHGMKKSLANAMEQMDSMFRMKFKVGSLVGYPGATYYNQRVLNTFVNISSQIAAENDYKGQVCIIIMGELCFSSSHI